MTIIKFQYFILAFVFVTVFLFSQEVSKDLDSMFDDPVVEEDGNQVSDKTNDAINFDDMFEAETIDNKDEAVVIRREMEASFGQANAAE